MLNMLSRFITSNVTTSFRQLSLTSCLKLIFKAEKEALPLPDGSFANYMMKSIYQHYVKSPTKSAIINVKTNETLTYGDVYLHALSVSSYLKDNNFHHGDIAAIILPNDINYPSITLGVTLNGGIITTISYAFTPREIANQLIDSEAKIIFTNDELLDNVVKSLELYPDVEKIIVINNTGDKLIETEKIIDYQIVKRSIPETHHENVEIIPKRDIFILPSSSGTTGAPKCVMLSHLGISSSILHFSDSIKNICTSILKDPPYDPEANPQLIFLPFYHIYGYSLMLDALKIGSTITTMPKIDLDLFCKTIQDYKIREIKCVPPIMVFLAKHPIVDKYDLSSLEFIICGAAPLHEDTINQVKKRLSHVKHVLQGYGMTEVSMCASLPDPNNPTANSVGKLCPGYELKFLDPENGKELGYNEPGEICLKSEQVMMGYLNKPQATAEALDDAGWIHTGDIGYIDEKGEIYYVERLKELIKVSGYQVPPAELEALLLEHPKIKDAGVIGIPNEDKGEVPRAFVVKNGDLTEDEVKEFIAKNAAPYKKLRGGVVFVDEIPKSSSGKILRRILRNKSN